MLKTQCSKRIPNDILMFEISVFLIYNTIKIWKLFFFLNKGVARCWNLENLYLKASFLKYQEDSSHWKIAPGIHEVSSTIQSKLILILSLYLHNSLSEGHFPPCGHITLCFLFRGQVLILLLSWSYLLIWMLLSVKWHYVFWTLCSAAHWALGWLSSDAHIHAFNTCSMRLTLCQVPGRQWYTSSS